MGVLAPNNEAVISQPALGQDVQLGMLYDVRTSQFFAGVSLWNNDVVNAKQQLDNDLIQNADYKFSYSMEEARKNSSLDIEGSLSLDLKLFSATGSAKYLAETKSSTHEARIDASCTIVRRTRRIPQETLSAMTHAEHLDDERFTHFVAEVTEGGSATLSFVQSCSSAEEAKKITGELKVSIVKIPVSGSAKVDFAEGNETKFEKVRISYSGAMAENVATLDDARRVAKEMPTKLAKQMNTLHYKLLPLSLLDNKARRLIRSLDEGLVADTAAALKAGKEEGLKLRDVADEVMFVDHFPAIRRQIQNFTKAYNAAETEFTAAARRLLPELRDGNTDAKEKVNELRKVVALFEQRVAIAEDFVGRKRNEALVLQDTVAALLKDRFENHLGGFKPGQLLDATPQLLLSFGGLSIGNEKHGLQKEIEERQIDNGAGSDSDSDDRDSDLDEEWFDNTENVARVTDSCASLRKQRALAEAAGVSVVFGVASIDKAYRTGKTKKSRTSIGDIVLSNKGKLQIVTPVLAKTPTAPELKVQGREMTVQWQSGRNEGEEAALLVTGYTVRYCRRRNALKDGAFPKADENEAATEVAIAGSRTTTTLRELSDGCDYEVAVSMKTCVGPTEWSAGTTARTDKLPSVAAEMIAFFANNEKRLTQSSPLGSQDAGIPRHKPWDMDMPKLQAGMKTLFLGQTEVARRESSNARFKGEVAVRIVDVALEFRPDIQAAPVMDEDNTIVAVFAGTSGHGKSTQINAFISYLLGGEVDDEARVLVVDDRGAKQAGSVTQIVTCFRIRPLSPLFKGKTLLIVDTPGYADSRGIERDNFVTAAMAEFFKTVNHVNTIVFTCRANEVRTTLLEPVSTYIFSLFAKNVRTCLRTVYTFSDVGEPLAHGALQELGWPVENGEISVNNSAFGMELNGGDNDAVVREGWLNSVRGQFLVLNMFLLAPPVPTDLSAQVTKTRISLEAKCALAEKKILRTANDAQQLISDLGALAKAVGAAPGDKIDIFDDVAEQRDLPPGKSTTLCLDCNFTCHKICLYSDDAQKINCLAMDNGKCRYCKGKCDWNRHKNAKYMIVVVRVKRSIVPREMITRWNSNNNSLEGSLLTAMDKYMDLQKELRDDIIELAKLSDELTKSALRHDSSGLMNYIDTLIKTARVQGAPPEQLTQLVTAKNTLLLLGAIKGKGQEVTRDSIVLLDVIGSVREEMDRRKSMDADKRADEEEKSCSLYNKMREKLPDDIKRLAPPKLQAESVLRKGAKYNENLQAVVKLVQIILKDGGIVAALAGSSNSSSS